MNYNIIRYTKCSLLVALLGITMPAAQAQYAKDYKRTADQFYAKGDYYSAAQYYEKYLNGQASAGAHYQAYEVKKQGPVKSETGSKTDDGGAKFDKKNTQRIELEYRLAESYRQLHDYSHASPWYKSVTEAAPAAYPLAHYWYAICLRVDGKYGWAQKELELFLKTYKTSDSYRSQAARELENNAFIQQELSDPKEDVLVAKMDANINKEGASYAAGWLNPTTLVFTSTRSEGGSDPEGAASGEKSAKAHPVYTNALYSTTLQNIQSDQAVQSSQSASAAQTSSSGKDSRWSKADKLNIPAVPDRQEGTATFTPGGQQLFFTAWSEDKEGRRHAAIYMSTKNGNDWSTPMALGDNINVEGADARQPQVTSDGGYLLFSSDRPGGKGGFDIWYAPLKGGQPGKAVNAGALINSKGDEQAPFYHNASQTLVFASNGRIGMGGFDLYAAKGSFPNSWSEPHNMGFPVNSVKDDLYFVAKGNRLLEDALLSSDRSSACCLELFTLHKKYTEYFIGQVLDSATHAPLAGVEITGKDMEGHLFPAQTTGPDGKYQVVANAGHPLQLNAAREKYQPLSWTAQPGTGDSVTNPTVYLAAIPEMRPDIFEGKKKLVTHNINFKFRIKELTPESYPYMDDVAAYLKANPGTKLEIAAHTDGIGTTAFNLKLSQQRAKACVEYLVKAGIDRQRLIAKGYGECCPLEKETTIDGKDDPAARENNRRVEMTLK
jgi:outer membrane protein OmpA-like peptidoglycan-associated protein/tetratricopeptide (TPR) repeat protein